MEKVQTTNHIWKQDLVLIAKNTYVWLYQLSRKYQRPIKQLDQIPTEELKKRCKKFLNTERDNVVGGDNNTSKGVLLPVKELI